MLISSGNPVPTYKNPCEFDHLMLEPVHAMMEKGIRVDQKKKVEVQAKTVNEWMQYQEILNRVAGFDLNANSTKVLAQLLYGELNLPKRTKTDSKTRKTRLTTDEEALRSLMAECRYKFSTLATDSAKRRWMEGYVICRYVLNIRRVRKEISSYLGLSIQKGKLGSPVPLEDEDGRIRGTISVGGTKTARFSHSKTLWDTGINLATVPRKLRDMYIPDDGYEMAEFDLNRGESWVYSHLSEDPELLRIHLNGLDFHSETGALISGIFAKGAEHDVEWIIEHSSNQDSKFYDQAYMIRYVAKKINHASSYRMRSKTGAKSVNQEADETGIAITVNEFDKARTKWLEKYFMIPQWWQEIEAQLEKDRTLITPYGRKLTFHDRLNDKTYREATAYVPSSTSVDYINRGFFKVYYTYQVKGAWGLSILAQTHDSILVQYRTECRDEALPSIAEALTSSITIKDRSFSIPIEAKYGQSWGRQEKYKLPEVKAA